jgi:hypothetical protein
MRPLQAGDIELHHLQQGIGDPLRADSVGIPHQLVRHRGHDPPSSAWLSQVTTIEIASLKS